MSMMMAVHSWMSGVSASFNVSIETVMLIGSVVDSSDCAIRFVEGVVSLDLITIALFVLLFMITSMLVFYTIFEVVFRVCLNDKSIFIEIA